MYEQICIAGNRRQRCSVDLKVIVWLGYFRNSIVLAPYYGPMQLCATMLSSGRLHVASTVLMLQGPFFISFFAGTFSFTCKYPSRPINKQFALSLSLPRTLEHLISLPKASRDRTSIYWNVSRHFCYHCTPSAIASFTRYRQNGRNLSLVKRRFRHIERTVLGKSLLNYITMKR